MKKTTRRGFVRRLLKTAAVVAVAPEVLAALPAEKVGGLVPPVPLPTCLGAGASWWYQTSLLHRNYDQDYLKAMNAAFGSGEGVPITRPSSEDLRALFFPESSPRELTERCS
jgi:hypothetical protein